jgi:hypothetical protein
MDKIKRIKLRTKPNEDYFTTHHSKIRMVTDTTKSGINS